MGDGLPFFFQVGRVWSGLKGVRARVKETDRGAIVSKKGVARDLTNDQANPGRCRAGRLHDGMEKRAEGEGWEEREQVGVRVTEEEPAATGGANRDWTWTEWARWRDEKRRESIHAGNKKTQESKGALVLPLASLAANERLQSETILPDCRGCDFLWAFDFPLLVPPQSVSLLSPLSSLQSRRSPSSLVLQPLV